MIRRLWSRLRRAARAEWYARWRTVPLDRSLVVWESFGGNGAGCNPEAMHLAMTAAPDLVRYRHVWALDRAAMRTDGRRLRRMPRTRVVRRDGPAYWRALAVAGTVVNNATFPPQYARRDGQRYCNTWHGTPLKRMGFDEPDGAAVSANVLRNLLNATHLLSQSRWMTDTMYRGAYRLDGLFHGEVLEVGYPRSDRLRLNPDQDRAFRDRLRRSGVRIDDELVVLYAPTWRGERFSSPEDHSAEMADLVEVVQSRLDRAGARVRVLVKPHQAVAASARHEPRLRHRIVPNDVPANVALGAAAVLVSDWSSILVDWLGTGRPVVLATGDGRQYASTRGLYASIGADWPGERCADDAEVADAVARALTRGVLPEHRAAHAALRDRLVGADDGRATERVLDVLFRGATPGTASHPGTRLDAAGPHRPNVLLHLGGMRDNGITAAALALLPRLADAGLDVTVTFPASHRSAQRANGARIDPRVRQLRRVGGMNGTKWAHLRRRASERRGVAFAHRLVPALRGLWDDEWRRCFGEARFDAVVDFSGYAPFWAQLLLHAPSPVSRAIWLHNDMAAETHRHVHGRARMRRGLETVIGLYPQFDAAVSVSAALADHNHGSLRDVAPAHYVSARNVVDAGLVLGSAAQPVADALRDAVPLGERAGWAAPSWSSSPGGADGTRWFVSVGRLSPEKNHDRLLRAFAAVHGDRPEARLLVLGDGWLRERLETLRDELGLTDVVVFAGAVRNPFAFMAAADWLVVSSDHEGQPMVVLEAATIGLPVVATAFDSVADVLPGGGVHVTERSVEGLAGGLRAALDGRVGPAPFDVDAYDDAAVAEFLTATGLDAAIAAQRDTGTGTTTTTEADRPERDRTHG